MESKQNAANFPPLHLPSVEIADSGTVRLGDSGITGQFPPLRLSPVKVADSGKVRLGDSGITAQFPLKQ